MTSISLDLCLAFTGGVFTGIILTLLWLITRKDTKVDNPGCSICAECSHMHDEQGIYKCRAFRHWVTGADRDCREIRQVVDCPVCSKFERKEDASH